jgi:hypothetical protein
MPDIWVRGVDEGSLARLRAVASARGLTTNDLICRIIGYATLGALSTQGEETRRILGLLGDLGNPEVMAGAWR